MDPFSSFCRRVLAALTPPICLAACLCFGSCSGGMDLDLNLGMIGPQLHLLSISSPLPGEILDSETLIELELEEGDAHQVSYSVDLTHMFTATEFPFEWVLPASLWADGEEHFLFVQAAGSTGTVGHGSVRIVVSEKADRPPVLMGPNGESVEGASVLFRWGAAPLHMSSHVQVSPDSSFSILVVDSIVDTDLLEASLPEGLYHWRVCHLWTARPELVTSWASSSFLVEE